MYGSGIYRVSAVKEIDGTEEYLDKATKNGECQQKGSYEDCLSKDYLTQGMGQCNCIPYKLRNYAKEVNETFKDIHIMFFLLQELTIIIDSSFFHVSMNCDILSLKT